MADGLAWVTPEQVQAACNAAWDPTSLDKPIEAASDILYALSGYRWPGPQADVVRPCSPLRAQAPRWLGTAYPPAVVGAGTGWCGCAGPELCGCATPGIVELAGTPVVSVERVTVDAVVLPPAAYRLMGQLLVRTDGTDWPCCQDWTVEGDQPGAFEVRYTWGALPPVAGEYACAALACELWRATSPDSDTVNACRLPKRITTISRQGVNLAMLDPMTMFPDGMTGLPEVDLWLGSLRYGQANRPSTVMVPGARSRHLRDTATP
jgi:hypothetical protein